MRVLLFALSILAYSTVSSSADSITVQIISTVPGASGTLTRSMTLTQAEMGLFIAGLEKQTNTVTATAAADSWLSAIKQEVISITLSKQSADALATVTPINPQ